MNTAWPAMSTNTPTPMNTTFICTTAVMYNQMSRTLIRTCSEEHAIATRTLPTSITGMTQLSKFGLRLAFVFPTHRPCDALRPESYGIYAGA